MILANTLEKPDSKSVGMAISIDFAPIFERNCQGAEFPDDLNSDYEKWIPHEYKS